MLVGVEHEYALIDGERQIDFRAIIHSLRLARRHLDPGDPHAYRLPSGAALTCDGAEAEIALPPVAVGPGFTREIEGRAAYERARLQRLVPGLELRGYSTHLGVTTRADIGDEVARLYCSTFAPTLNTRTFGARDPTAAAPSRDAEMLRSSRGNFAHDTAVNALPTQHRVRFPS
jgi:hypothetical protein